MIFLPVRHQLDGRDDINIQLDIFKRDFSFAVELNNLVIYCGESVVAFDPPAPFVFYRLNNIFG